MTVYVINKHGIAADRVLTLSGIQYATPQNHCNSVGDMVIETPTSKIEVVVDNPNIKAVVIVGAISQMATSITKLIKETKRTLEEIFDIMALLNANYQNGAEYSVIALKNNGDIEELKVVNRKVSYSLYRADERCRVFGSGVEWLYPFEGKVETFKDPLTPHEHIALLHSFTSDFGKTYDYYDLISNTLDCKIDLSTPARKKLHQSAVKKLASMSPLHHGL